MKANVLLATAFQDTPMGGLSQCQQSNSSGFLGAAGLEKCTFPRVTDGH